MDFSDTQEEACFRQEVRSWLQTNGTALRSTSPPMNCTRKLI